MAPWPPFWIPEASLLDSPSVWLSWKHQLLSAPKELFM